MLVLHQWLSSLAVTTITRNNPSQFPFHLESLFPNHFQIPFTVPYTQNASWPWSVERSRSCPWMEVPGWRECRNRGRKTVPHLTCEPKQPVFILRHPTSGPLSSSEVSTQGCGCLGEKNPTASFLGALRNQSLRFRNSQDPLEKIYGVRAAFEDFRPSDVCPKAHVWFLRLLNKPGLLASKRFPCGLLPCTLSSPLHEMHWVSALGSETP